MKIDKIKTKYYVNVLTKIKNNAKIKHIFKSLSKVAILER